MHGGADEGGDFGVADGVEEGNGAPAGCSMGELPAGDIVTASCEWKLACTEAGFALDEKAVAVECVNPLPRFSFCESLLAHGGDEEMNDSHAGGTGAEHGDALVLQRHARGMDGGEQRSRG